MRCQVSTGWRDWNVSMNSRSPCWGRSNSLELSKSPMRDDWFVDTREPSRSTQSTSWGSRDMMNNNPSPPICWVPAPSTPSISSPPHSTSPNPWSIEPLVPAPNQIYSGWVGASWMCLWLHCSILSTIVGVLITFSGGLIYYPIKGKVYTCS